MIVEVDADTEKVIKAMEKIKALEKEEDLTFANLFELKDYHQKSKKGIQESIFINKKNV